MTAVISVHHLTETVADAAFRGSLAEASRDQRPGQALGSDA
jgi:hypothetical protein